MGISRGRFIIASLALALIGKPACGEPYIREQPKKSLTDLYACFIAAGQKALSDKNVTVVRTSDKGIKISSSDMLRFIFISPTGKVTTEVLVILDQQQVVGTATVDDSPA